jgi:hypothetical protein
MRSTATLIAAACLLIAADEPKGQGQGQQPGEPQAKYEPRSGPGAGQKLLERFVGDWDVVKTFYPATGEPVRAQGRCRQAMIHDGRFLRSEFVFQQGGKETTGLGLIGFEPETGTFTSVWTDSRQTRMSFRQGRDKFDGETIVLYSGSLDPDAKESRRTRTVSRLEEGDRKLIHRQYLLGPGGGQRLMMELEMTRRGDAPPTGR